MQIGRYLAIVLLQAVSNVRRRRDNVEVTAYVSRGRKKTATVPWLDIRRHRMALWSFAKVNIIGSTS
jgi:hypothetical protein